MQNGAIGFINAYPRCLFQFSSMVPPFRFFRPHCGMRQGDPFSPFLFILVTKVLTYLLKREEALGGIHGVRIARAAPPITHLLFSDDIMLFYRATKGDVQNLHKVLHSFASWSGQVINPVKSFLLFSRNLTLDHRSQHANILRIQPSSAIEAGNYLGLSLALPRSHSQTCQAVQDKITSKLAGWKARSLSQPGRTVLIQSMASTIPSYYMSVFLLPKQVTRGLNL